jgi:hypothetical protein
MVRVERVPVELGGHRAAWDAQPDDVGAVGRLLRVHRHAVVHRRISGDDDRVGGDGLAIARAHGGRRVDRTIRELLGMRPAEDAPPGAVDRACEPGEVLEWVELRLPWEAETRSRVERRIRGARQSRHVDEPRTVRGLELTVQDLRRVAGPEEEIAVHDGELARDRLLGDDRLHTIDRCGVALGGVPRTACTVDALDPEVPVVERVGDVRCRASGLPTTHMNVVQDDDALSRAAEQVGGGEPGDPGAHDADVDAQVLEQPRVLRDVGAVHPRRGRTAGVAEHGWRRRTVVAGAGW